MYSNFDFAEIKKPIKGHHISSSQICKTMDRQTGIEMMNMAIEVPLIVYQRIWVHTAASFNIYDTTAG